VIGMIGELLGLTPDRIGLKATTMEQLGEIGAGLGLAAQVVVSVEFLKN
jgi:2-C-methyl-D-erythritol 4-phosphate cytidylyltransferase/2-C-methyl-D-erythritol 2,4-cyclodiphosphate synthase